MVELFRSNIDLKMCFRRREKSKLLWAILNAFLFNMEHSILAGLAHATLPIGPSL